MLSSGSYSNITVALDVAGDGSVIISADWGAAQTYGITVNVQIGGVVSFATVASAWTSVNTGYTRRVSFTTFGNGTRIDQLSATSLGVGTTPSGNTGDITVAGFVNYSVNSAVTAAGTTQGTAFAIATNLVEITTGTVNQGVILPARTGTRITIRNTTAVTIKVYPNSLAQINSLGTNIGFDLITLASLEFVCFSATQWYTLNATFA
jgi:hypothetical protein